MNRLDLAAAGIRLSLDLDIGHIAALDIDAGARTLRPLHRAPWIDEPATRAADWSPGTKGLSGDFLCAPFSASDVEPAPLHGWPSNSVWEVVENVRADGDTRARLRLGKTVCGAVVEKVLTLRDGHPFVYQEHRFVGGTGELPAAHHPMTVMQSGGRIGFSPKRVALTSAVALETDPARGRHTLAYPARSSDLSKFPAAAGGAYDLTTYPADGSAEDFVTLVEDVHDGPGWTAVARHHESDLFLVLKNPRELPITMLWISNGGRDYAPWNGRHRGVLGVEDGRTAVGHAASIGDNPLKSMGIATSFKLDPNGVVSFRHVLGSLPLESEHDAPDRVVTGQGRLRAVFAGGGDYSAPFDDSFLRIGEG